MVWGLLSLMVKQMGQDSQPLLKVWLSLLYTYLQQLKG